MANAAERQPLLASRSLETSHLQASITAKSARQYIHQENVLRIHAQNVLSKYSTYDLVIVHLSLYAGFVSFLCACVSATLVGLRLTPRWTYVLVLAGLSSLGLSMFLLWTFYFAAHKVVTTGMRQSFCSEPLAPELREAVVCLSQFMDGVDIVEAASNKRNLVSRVSTLAIRDINHIFYDLYLGPGDVVRILELEPGSFDSDIRCRLFVRFRLESYEAVSYTWGDHATTKSIVVNGRPWAVTQNLETTLRHLRYETKPRMLWIDAICINQQDDDEKNRVVGMMTYVYKEATDVVAFLGNGPDFSELFDFLNRANNAPDTDELLLTIGLPLVFGQLLQLLEAEWWSRIWIIQEFAYAFSDPLLGYNTNWIKASVLLRGFIILQERLHMIQHHTARSILGGVVKEMPSLIQSKYMMLETRHLLLHWRSRFHPVEFRVSELLRTTQWYKASDARDKIFALRSFMMEPIRTIFTADYKLSTSTLYTRTAAYLLCVEQWNDIYNTFPIRTQINLPSWVPDFSYSGTNDACIYGGETGIYSLTAGPSECSVFAGILAIRVLTVGVVDCIDDITTVSTGDMFITRREGKFNLRDMRKKIMDSFFHSDGKPTVAEQFLEIFNHYYHDPTTRVPFITMQEVDDIISELSPSTVKYILELALRSQHTKPIPKAVEDVAHILRTSRQLNVLRSQVDDCPRQIKRLDAKLAYTKWERGLKFSSLSQQNLEQELQDDIDDSRMKTNEIRKEWAGIEKRINQKTLDDKSAMIKSLDGRVVFRTDSELYGLGPMNTKMGDKLAVFAGVSGAFLVRNQEEGLAEIIGKYGLTTGLFQRWWNG